MSRFTPLKPVSLALYLLVQSLFAAPAHADAITLEVYETYYSTKKVAGVVDSLLKPGETIKVFGNKMIVRASDETHEKILFVLKEIDRAPKNFLISIRSTDQYDSQKRYHSGNIKVLNDNTVVHINNQTPPEDGVIVYKGSSRDGKISMAVTSQDNLTTRQENLVQQIRTMEGEQAFITTGDEIPVNQLVWVNGEVLPVTGRDVSESGFYVRPIFSKGQVLLEISYQQQSRDNPKQTDKKTTELSTRIRIPVNEWTPLAGLSRVGKSTGEGTVFSTRGKGNQQQGIEIKVETIN